MKNDPGTCKRENINVFFCIECLRWFYTYMHRVINSLERSFNFSWIQLCISYHIFNNLNEQLNGDLAGKIGRGIHSHELMDRSCKFSNLSKVNGKCVFEAKFWRIFLIYEVKYILCDIIYIGNIHKTKKSMYGHFSDAQSLLKIDISQNNSLPIMINTLTLLCNV